MLVEKVGMLKQFSGDSTKINCGYGLTTKKVSGYKFNVLYTPSINIFLVLCIFKKNTSALNYLCLLV